MRLYFFYLLENELGGRTLYSIVTDSKKDAKKIVIDNYDYKCAHAEYIGIMPISHSDVYNYIKSLSEILIADNIKTIIK